MRTRLAGILLLAPALAGAQVVLDDEEFVVSDSPEAWAMNYVVASTLMTSFGATPVPDAGEWDLSVDLGHVPRLSREQQRVGFAGEKQEDLNKSPVFGRLRIGLGLGAGFRAEIGYTPPLTIDGAQPRDLVSLALGKRWWQGDAFSLSSRLFGQHGRAHGDITCPAAIAGPFDAETNPFGCVQRSDDRIALNYYGADLTVAGGERWEWHATAGVLRSEPTVRVNARVFTVIDNSRLVTRGVLPYVSAGLGRDIAPGWHVAGELLHVPLDVQRTPGDVENDALTSLRVLLRWSPRR